MVARCPGQCAIGNQRPLELRKISQISPKARAEIALLKKPRCCVNRAAVSTWIAALRQLAWNGCQ
jgi:hypothetical protein